eukprot:CAMPEP_0168395694 /NCGR_PEP_ID=MMETSP0228-20121227/20176_1 /TAXON_ID=133427 /ORGANISM="Protoceratium reticulatum, Strain CCCM 535 (=CCMP 1889)" /LENGTH=306 /DNA_ID=CAMNT_0008409135 /DNA_START=1 /DNA_END=921 /DNA_ORIENTATION=-
MMPQTSGLMSADEVDRAEERQARESVRHEFFDRPNDNAFVEQELHNDNSLVDHVYGGEESAMPREEQLVQAWRPTPWGEWQLAMGVIHRVHHDDRTLTIQFIPDQHRVRVPFMSAKPILDITPEYPTIRLAPGERLPTPGEIRAREQNANEKRRVMGIPADAPMPDVDYQALRPGETMSRDGVVTLECDYWGIPAPTLEALRNRSIPACQVVGEYRRHFFTDLYQNNFYHGRSGEEREVSAAGRVGVPEPQHDGFNGRVISHTYVPLDGQPLEQDLDTGRWAYQDGAEPGRYEAPSVLPKWLWFLG